MLLRSIFYVLRSSVIPGCRGSLQQFIRSWLLFDCQTFMARCMISSKGAGAENEDIPSDIWAWSPWSYPSPSIKPGPRDHNSTNILTRLPQFSLRFEQRGDKLSLRLWLIMWPPAAARRSISCNSTEIGSADDKWAGKCRHLHDHPSFGSGSFVFPGLPWWWWLAVAAVAAMSDRGLLYIFLLTMAAAEERDGDAFWWRTVFAQSCSTDEHWGSGGLEGGRGGGGQRVEVEPGMWQCGWGWGGCGAKDAAWTSRAIWPSASPQTPRRRRGAKDRWQRLVGWPQPQ